MKASFRVEQVASNYTASCRNLLNLRTRKKADLLLIVRLLFLPMDAGLVTDEQKRGESGEMWVRDEDIRSGQSHRKSNMHFRQGETPILCLQIRTENTHFTVRSAPQSYFEHRGSQSTNFKPIGASGFCLAMT